MLHSDDSIVGEENAEVLYALVTILDFILCEMGIL
jgi:hypothetical protein